MKRVLTALLAGLLTAAAAPGHSQVQAPTVFATTKVEGTDNVYVFRYQGSQSMFVVTPEGVIATDPIGQHRPQAVAAYIQEIRKVSQAPIKYVIYSSSHFDHIAGGKPFKDLGAVFIAHRNAKALLLRRRNPEVVIPDQTVDTNQRIIKLGATTLELDYVGRNGSDSSLVMRLPRERVVFVVDFLPLHSTQFSIMADTYLPDLVESIQKIIGMDWDRLIPGHPGPGGRATGTKLDAQEQLEYLQTLSAEVKRAVDQGKSLGDTIRDVKLPKFESFAGYSGFLAGNIERYYDYWNRGI